MVNHVNGDSANHEEEEEEEEEEQGEPQGQTQTVDATGEDVEVEQKDEENMKAEESADPCEEVGKLKPGKVELIV